ncbi:MAG: flagellar export chaperone FliS [Chloroflexota bacterium]
MPLANPYQAYRHTAAKTSDRGELLVMTYEAILRWLNRADAAIDADKVTDAHTALVSAQDLIHNLAWSLDFERGGQVADNLKSLYDYMLDQLMWANVNKDKELIDRVRGLVAPLLDAWRVAVVRARREAQAQRSAF